MSRWLNRIVQRFVRERGTTRLPVMAPQMPPTPLRADFYEELLVFGHEAELSVRNLRKRVRVLARQLGVAHHR